MANTTKKPLSSTIDAILPLLVSTRRNLHMHPETAFQEFTTQAALLQFMKDNCDPNISIRKCANTGIIVDIGPANAVKVIALRADMDALNMTEANKDMPWRSKIEGKAHMCGHDGHMTMLLGAAILLSKAQKDFPVDYRVRLLFQPAEEAIGGARVMIEEGSLQGVSEIYGTHAWGSTSLGQLQVVPGPIMAHVKIFEVVISGKGGHASTPEAFFLSLGMITLKTSVDPIVAACHTVIALQSIVSRNVPPAERAVLSVTMVHGGEADNVIPDSVTLGGTIRVLSSAVGDLIKKRFFDIVNSTSSAFGTKATINMTDLYPELINTPAEATRVRKVAEKIGIPVSTTGLPMMAAEDFSFYTKSGTPGAFFFVGSKYPDGTHGSNHQTNFDFCDHIIAQGVTMWVRLVEDFMEKTLFE